MLVGIDFMLIGREAWATHDLSCWFASTCCDISRNVFTERWERVDGVQPGHRGELVEKSYSRRRLGCSSVVEHLSSLSETPGSIRSKENERFS